jgi:hypothetical protein
MDGGRAAEPSQIAGLVETSSMMVAVCRARFRRAVVESLEDRRLLAASLVGTFTGAPPAAMADQEMATASYVVKNVGSSASTDFVPVFVLEQNSPMPGAGGQVDFAAVTSIGTNSTTSTLAAGKTATETLEFVLPRNLSGTVYIIGEFSQSNYFASTAIDVNGSTPVLSDQFVQGSVPTTVAFGSTVTPQLQISNTGTAEAAGQEVTDYFLSASNSPTQQLGSGVQGVYFVGSSTESIDLMPGQSATETPSLTLPNTASIPTGTYYLVAQGNQGSAPIADPVTNNPVAISGAIAVTAAVQGATSQLVPSLARTELPASMLSSSRTTVAATVSIQNQGSSTYSGSTRLALYFSLSATLDSTAVPVAAVVRSLRISTGKSVLIRVPLGSIPAVANGNYHLLAQVTDPTGATNSAAAVATTSVSVPYVALAASLAALGPNPIKAGATLEVQNAGNINDVSVLDYTLGFSTDPNGVVAIGGSAFGRTAGRITLRHGATVRIHVGKWSSIASGLAPGQYYLTVFVEDAGGNTSMAVSTTPVTIA